MTTYRGRDIDLKPTASMQANAKQSLAWREEFGRGMTAVGVRRARQIIEGNDIPPDDVREMRAWFARHEVDKKGQGFREGEDGFPSAGRIAWEGWGGDEGQAWAKRKVEQLEKIDEDSSMKATVRAFSDSVTKTVGERQIRVVVSTPRVDRSGDIVDPNGIDFADYRKNPVVLYQHDHSRPIARALEIGMKNGRIEALVQFPPPDISDLSDEVYGLIKSGILNSVSIGFLPLEYDYVDPSRPHTGRRYKKSEAIEFSIVSIPANPDALIVERAMADELRVGDFVRWNASGGTARGKIERIERDGVIQVPDSSFEITGTPDDPAAMIRVYREREGGWMPTARRVGHRFTTLSKIDALPEPEAKAYQTCEGCKAPGVCMAANECWLDEADDDEDEELDSVSGIKPDEDKGKKPKDDLAKAEEFMPCADCPDEAACREAKACLREQQKSVRLRIVAARLKIAGLASP